MNSQQSSVIGISNDEWKCLKLFIFLFIIRYHHMSSGQFFFVFSSPSLTNQRRNAKLKIYDSSRPEYPPFRKAIICNVMSGDITPPRFSFLWSTCSLPFSLSPSFYCKINGHLRKANLTRAERTLQIFFSREKNAHVISD